MNTVGVIPARLQSSRLPRKLLLDDSGKPLIQYVWEAAVRADALDDVVVATDSDHIAAVVRSFGGRAELTGEHPSGSDRTADVVRRCFPAADVVVNLQGDEPELDPAHIDSLVATLRDHPGDEMATLAAPLTSAESIRDPGCVKVVCAGNGRALYFSRSVVPFPRDAELEHLLSAAANRPADSADQPSTINHQPLPWLLHLGIYAYRRDFLLRLTQLPLSPLEQIEKLEQLRALEAGATIRVAIVDNAAPGIDTPADYARFVERQRTRAA